MAPVVEFNVSPAGSDLALKAGEGLAERGIEGGTARERERRRAGQAYAG
jgi:hypothetical protein